MVSRQECARAGEVRQWLPEADLSNLRLHPVAHHTIEIEQPGGRTDNRGQFVLPVNPPAQNTDALFQQAQRAEEIGDVVEAERLYRLVMKCDPTDAAPPFNLGNMLRANGRKVEAESALRTATRADPTFAEAWYNLSDLLDEQGRSEAAIECLRRHAAAALRADQGARPGRRTHPWRRHHRAGAGEGEDPDRADLDLCAGRPTLRRPGAARGGA